MTIGAEGHAYTSAVGEAEEALGQLAGRWRTAKLLAGATNGSWSLANGVHA